MTKSKYDIFWIAFLTLMMLWCLLLFIIGFSQYFFNLKLFGMGTQDDKFTLLLFFPGLLGFITFFVILWREANIITIDTISKIIAFKNIFTRRREEFPFANFSGYVDTEQRTRHRMYKVLYIVKDKKYVKKISAAIYENFDELIGGLNAVKYLGFKKLGLKERFQILFDKPMAD